MSRLVGVRGWPLGAYFLLLVALMVGSAAAAALYVRTQAAEDAHRAAAQHARFAARTAATQLGQFIALQSAAVRQLAANPRIAESLGHPAGCSLTYSGIGGADGTHIDVIRADGSVACSSRALPAGERRPSYGGTAFLRRALQGDVFVAPTIDAATGAAVAISARPIPGGKGVVAGFADLTSLGPELVSLYGGDRSIEFLVTTANGQRAVARSIDPARWAGASISGTAFARANGSERHDLSGTPRLYEETTVPGVGWRFYAGEDKATAFGAGHRLERRQLNIILAGLAAVILGTLFVYRRLALPIQRLAQEVRSAGLLSEPTLARISGPAELAGLAEDIGNLISSANRELVERQRAEALAGAVIESALDAVITIDHEGTILEFNPAAERKFGRARADVLGKEMAELLIPPALREHHRRGLARLVETDDGPILGTRVEVPALRADGTEFPIELAITRLPLDGRPVFTSYVRDISQRKSAEKALRDSEEKYRLLFADHPNPMWVFDAETLRFLEVNDAAVRSYGYSRDEFLEMTVGELCAPDDTPGSAYADGEGGIRPHRLKDGTRIEAEVTTSVHDFEGRRARVAVALDVTERVLADKALRESETRYRDLIENALELIATVDLQGRLTSVNGAFERSLGYSRAELISRPLSELVPPEFHEQLDRISLTRDGERSSESRIDEHELVARDGHRIAVEVSSRPIDEDGRPAGHQAIWRDISKRRQAERDLRAAELRYRTLVEQLPLVSYTESLNTASAAYISPQIADLVGYTAEEWTASSDFFSGVLHPDDRERVIAEIATLHRTGQPFDSEYRVVARDGRIVWVRDGAVVVRPDEGQHIYAQGYMLDVTEHHSSEEALKESRELYRLVVESTTDMISLSNLDGRIIYASPSHLDVLGRSQDELLGRKTLDLVHLDDRDAAMALAADAPAIGNTGTPLRLRHKDGRYINVQTTTRPIPDQAGIPRLTLTTSRDVTDRDRAGELEEQLRQAQRLESVGQLAGGIAHDFNNLLTVISGYTEALLEDGDPASSLELAEIAAAAQRATILTQQLLAFSRRQVLQPRVVDLNTVVDGIMPMLSRLIGENIDLAAALDAELEPVLADPNQIEQVVINLAVNARDAMPHGGRLTIETGNVDLDHEYVEGHPEASVGRHVMVAVTDTGFGMDTDTKARLFEPFFTTKPVGAGTGLGLSTVYGIVKQSGGTIWVYSEPGEGSSFKIYLPAADAASVAAPAKKSENVVPNGTETILIAEDEEAVRDLTARALKRRGYSVLAAESPHEALRLIDEGEQSIDLLLTDLVMPQMGGRELADHVIERIPTIRVLFMSGYADEAVTRSGAVGFGSFLEKPFSALELSSKVREVLDARGGP
jgi:two-component system cell cycle sensor histidine kinase/response regulator CckA